MMVETRPVGLWSWFLGCGCGPCYFLHHQTVFPPFNDDLGTMPTRRPYSWKKNGKRGNGSLHWFTGQGTSLGVQRHAAVVDAQAFRPLQHDIEYARVRCTAVQGVHC